MATELHSTSSLESDELVHGFKSLAVGSTCTVVKTKPRGRSGVMNQTTSRFSARMNVRFRPGEEKDMAMETAIYGERPEVFVLLIACVSMYILAFKAQQRLAHSFACMPYACIHA